MRSADFDYSLPEELIALRPAPQRDESRLLVLDRASGAIRHQANFREILRFFRPGDVLVLNNSRVIPARVRGQKTGTGGEIELLLLEELNRNEWWALLRPGRRVRIGTQIQIQSSGDETLFTAQVLEKNSEGHCRLVFRGQSDIAEALDEIGEIPLPPYIDRCAEEADRERYQTVFAAQSGSVAAPTAGLHFTTELLARARQIGVQVYFVTLHVGLGTFAPVKEDCLENHRMHEERFQLDRAAAAGINAALTEGRRIFAVGTTTVRVLESVAAENNGRLVEMLGRTRIFIYPPFRFQVVSALITNFHLPQSTLLMLVSAFAAPGEARGRELVLAAYAEAVQRGYLFFSYGDAMLIL